MSKKMLILFFVCCTGIPVFAQDLSNIQIHGFATQGVLYSNENNYFTADTSHGSVQWTDGAVSISDNISDKLRVGIQVHMYILGTLGGPVPEVDWVTGDYKVNEHIGIRVGKVKTPLGLFNDIQDIDSAFLWAILPESNYPLDNRDATLSHYGVDLYGTYDLGHAVGKFVYKGYFGYRYLDLQSGTVEGFTGRGTIFTTTPNGKLYGGDIRWVTPLKGLMIGGSESISELAALTTTGSLNQPLVGTEAAYIQYERGKFYFATEAKRRPQDSIQVVNTTTQTIVAGKIVNTTTSATTKSSSDRREAFFMASYRILPKLQAGAYWSREFREHTNPNTVGDWFNDGVVSARIDINSYFYFKVEEHFITGASAALYVRSNPTGYRTAGDLFAAKLGFAF